MSCKFSSPYTGSLCVVSGDGAYVACITSGNRLTIRATDTLEVTHIFQCVDRIDKVDISPDCAYVLCALYSRNVVQVFSIEDKEWKCRINEGVAGIINAYWTPDSRNVVTESDFGIQLSLWSLTEGNSVIVSLPKPPFTPFSRTLAFSDCGRFMAVVHRIELQDQIGVYTVCSQTSLGMGEVSKFRARSNDVAAVYWVPAGTHIITLDSPLSYKFCAYTPMGECLVQYDAYQNALGIRSIALARPAPLPATASASASAPSTALDCKFLALGSFDGRVRLMSAHSWQLAFVLPLVHPRELEAGFSGQALRLTVECTSTQAGLYDSSSGGAAETEEETGGNEMANSLAGAQAEVKQRQVPPQQQVLVRSSLRPVRKDFATLMVSGSTEAALVEADTDRTRAESSSFFALRHLSSLPRNQSFVSDAKKTLGTSTAPSKSTTVKKAPGASTTSSTAPSAVAATSALSATTGFPAVGVSWLGWSSSNSLLAAREESHPRCMWVWRPLSAQLVALLVLLEPVTCARWRPQPKPRTPATTAPPAPSAEGTEGVAPPAPPAELPLAVAEEADVLAFCTGTDKVYFWTASKGVTFAEASALGVEDGGHYSDSAVNRHHFTVMSLRWTKDGSGLILRGKESHCLCTVRMPLTTSSVSQRPAPSSASR